MMTQPSYAYIDENATRPQSMVKEATGLETNTSKLQSPAQFKQFYGNYLLNLLNVQVVMCGDSDFHLWEGARPHLLLFLCNMKSSQLE